tara:strand:+ start:894 stop:1115 length:222 start_codon:yes stop_codon:yes gene_type:complete
MLTSQELVFKGSFVEVKRVESELISNRINPIIINKKQSAILSGFGYNPNDQILIYVFSDQLELAKQIIKDLAI